MFITIDGGDGCGKSTQAKLLVEWLKNEKGKEVVSCRDPGSTQAGNAIRELLLHRNDFDICTTSEMFLFMAARAQMVEEIICPALEKNKTVVSDRYLLSNLVYQGCAGGIELDTLRSVGKIATGGVMPDIGIVLDVSYETAMSRLQNRHAEIIQNVKHEMDRMESKGEEYHQRVRHGFLELAAAEPLRYFVIDASLPIKAVQHAIRNAVQLAIKR
ncbi:MAG: dTMP kinase [Thermoguttaceae bacterium]